jgi:hypothetical protein
VVSFRRPPMWLLVRVPGVEHYIAGSDVRKSAYGKCDHLDAGAGKNFIEKNLQLAQKVRPRLRHLVSDNSRRLLPSSVLAGFLRASLARRSAVRLRAAAWDAILARAERSSGVMFFAAFLPP